jgi:DNA-binding protein H-NS
MSLPDLLAQKEAIEAAIEAAKQESQKEAMETITTIMKQYGIKKVVLGNKVAAKYKDSVTGKTWSGRGLKPKFVVEAEAAGTLVTL